MSHLSPKLSVGHQSPPSSDTESESSIKRRDNVSTGSGSSKGSVGAGGLYLKRVSSGDPEFEGRPAPVIQAGSLDPHNMKAHPCHHCGSVVGSIDRHQTQPRHSRRGSRDERSVDRRTFRSCDDNRREAPIYATPEKDHENLADSVVKEMEMAPNINPKQPRQPSPKKRTKSVPGKEVYKFYIFRWAEIVLRQILWHLGHMIAKYSAILLIIPVLLFLLSMVGIIMQRDNLGYRSPFESFSQPKSTQDEYSSDDSRYYEVKFNGSNPAYNALYRTQSNNFAIILKTAKRRDSIIQEEHVDHYFTIKSKLEKMKIKKGKKMLQYSTLCHQSCGKDVLTSIMASGSSVALTYPETFISDKEQNNVSRIFVGTTFGGVETDPDGAIARARSLAIYPTLKPNVDPSVITQWDDKFQQILAGEASELKDLKITWWSYGSFLSAVASSFRTIYNYLGFSILIGIILVMLCCCAKDSYHSKPILGLTIVITLVFSTVGGTSILIGTQGYLNAACFPAFFIISAVGLLILLSLHQSWRKYSNVAVEPAEKLAFLLSWDGPCSVCSCIAIIVVYGITAAVTKMPYFRYISLLMIASIFLLIVFALLFFSVIVYLTGRREASGVKWFKFWEKGDRQFPLPMLEIYEEKDLETLHKKLCDVEQCFSRGLGASVSRVHFRFMALLFFAIYLIFAIWGCSITPIKLNEDQFLSKDSEPQKFLNDYRKYYGKYEEYIELVFDDILDYMNAKTRNSIFRLLEWAQEEQYATRVVSWLQDFVRFEHSSIYLVNQDTFVPVVNLVFLQSDSYKSYAADIVFDKYQSQIISSRMYLQVGHYGLSKRLNLINGLLTLAKEEQLPLKIHAPFTFLLEHDVQLKSSSFIVFTIVTLMLSCLGMLLFAQPFVALLTLISCISVAVGTIGYAGLWGVPLNAVNAGIVLLGLSYTACICFQFCHHFADSGPTQRTSCQRMEYTFQSCFMPAFCSAVIPLLCFLPLLVVGIPMVFELSKLLLLEISLSLGHLLLFLPPCTLLFTEHVPKLFGNCSKFCDDTCCICCDMEEDADSIYYIPTTGKSLDPDTLRRFFNSRYGGEGISVSDHYALPPPPRREMLMPPPPIDPDLIGTPGRRHSYYQRSEIVDGSYHGSVTPTGSSYTPRRARSESSERNHRVYRVREQSPSPERQIISPTPTRRSFAAQIDDGKSVEESIYEEPPASVAESGSVYIVDKQSAGRNKMVSENKVRSKPSRQHSPGPKNQYPPRYSRDDMYRERDRYPLPHEEVNLQDLRPNWKQYLLDGAVRQPYDMRPPMMSMGPRMMPSNHMPLPMPGPMRPMPINPMHGHRPMVRALHRLP